jgi:hypothetical protein
MPEWLSENLILTIVGGGFCVYLAYAAAKFGTTDYPLSWTVVLLSGCVAGLSFFLLFYLEPSGPPLFGHIYVGLSAFSAALWAGARSGQKEQLQTIERIKARGRHQAALGPCATCGSYEFGIREGDDDERSRCDTCQAVHCFSCRLKHRPYSSGRELPCPHRGDSAGG